MADNVIIPASGSGDATPTIAADDVGGAKYQRVKISVGADGVVGDATPANPLPVDDADSQVLYGAVTEAAPGTDTASSGLNGRLQRVAQRLTSLIGLLPASLGQKASAASLAVVVASDQSAVPVSAAVLPLPTGAATEATLGLIQVSGGTAIGSLKGQIVDATATASAPTYTEGTVNPLSQTLAGALRVGGTVTANIGSSGSLALDASVTAHNALLGAVTETAPATDTASSGLNGRLQRIAQRLTSLLAVLPAALGQTTKAGSLSVTLASNQDALPITDNAGSLTVDNAGTFAVQSAATEVRATTGAAPTAFTSTTSATIFSSNAARKLFTVYNNSDKDLYLMLAAAAASATSYHVKVVANGGYFSTTDYSGEIRGIMSATITTGQVNPGEFT